jgi:hypothetical protein
LQCLLQYVLILFYFLSDRSSSSHLKICGRWLAQDHERTTAHTASSEIFRVCPSDRFTCRTAHLCSHLGWSSLTYGDYRRITQILFAFTKVEKTRRQGDQTQWRCIRLYNSCYPCRLSHRVVPAVLLFFRFLSFLYLTLMSAQTVEPGPSPAPGPDTWLSQLLLSSPHSFPH